MYQIIFYLIPHHIRKTFLLPIIIKRRKYSSQNKNTTCKMI